jgi:hypothetical protein
MNLEICWFSLPLCAVLSQIGGTWWKGARRFLIPLTMLVTYVTFVGWNWLLIPMALLQWGAFSLPVTLKGDSIPGGGILNLAWLPVNYTLVAAPPLLLAPHLWFVSVILGCVMALLTTLSNVPSTAKYFQWKMIEAFSGMSPVIVLCLAITI